MRDSLEPWPDEVVIQTANGVLRLDTSQSIDLQLEDLPAAPFATQPADAGEGQRPYIAEYSGYLSIGDSHKQLA